MKSFGFLADGRLVGRVIEDGVGRLATITQDRLETIATEVIHALRGYLAVFLVLSCSSPFQRGRLTGLKSYRQMAIGALPRTGTPPVMRTCGDYEAVVERYRAIEAIEDGSELRWDIRPSASYATIELRIW